MTIIGVIIGTTSIITMLSLGIGMEESFEKEISQMGSLNEISISNFNYSMEAPSMSTSKSLILDDKVLKQIEGWKEVELVVPVLESQVKFVSGKYVAYINVVGMPPEAYEKLDFEVENGRILKKEDDFVLLFGNHVSSFFYNPRTQSSKSMMYDMSNSPLVNIMKDNLEISLDMTYGEKSRNDSQNKKLAKVYKISSAGILKESLDDKDYNAYININTLKRILKENDRLLASEGYRQSSNNGYDTAIVKVKDIDMVLAVQNRIKELGFGVFSMIDILKSVQESSKSMQRALGGIGAISMLVAAIGISNTMFMSINERTREIGVMKVLGASFSDIRKLFLFEAGMIGFFGGIAGLVISYIISFFLNTAGAGSISFIGTFGEGSKTSIIPFWLGAYAIAFAIVVGLVSGIYPANKAMKLSALEAIKTE